jgi:hypothetical protein
MRGLGSFAKAAVSHQASSSEGQTSPRKRPKFYAVRKGRNIGVYETWEECERQTKGYSSEFKRFDSFEEAENYIFGRRLNFMTFRRAVKPFSSFVGGKELRAQIDIWQGGHATAISIECGLDTMFDVNLVVPELLHDLHDIVVDNMGSCGG